MSDTEPAQQVAALPFICRGDEIQILLITTRGRGRWAVPKGWPKKRLSLADAAAEEALEEAGVVGRIGQSPLGSFDYKKRMPEGHRAKCRVAVYPLLVTEHKKSWREGHERDFRWAQISEAADLVHESGLRRILTQLEENNSAALRLIAAA